MNTFEEAVENVRAELVECSGASFPYTLAHFDSEILGDEDMWTAAVMKQVGQPFRIGAVMALRALAAKATDASVASTWSYGVADTVVSKQADYGHANILRFGVEGIRVRLSDKVARINNLTAKKVDPLNESLVDSWVDIAGYCIVGMMVVRGTFELPLADDLRKQKAADVNVPAHASWLTESNVHLPLRTIICENGDIHNWSASAHQWVYAGHEAK